ncbi:t-SNARE [Ophiobolus disseminans]|uniref:t-SNARE n=1 Tax=Ophiobolus disseminans TaxID=1469910 RepID=A0A6A6ZQJ8_9PLEO|nr:t-SNARE [Ophiobolus disseminans]
MSEQFGNSRGYQSVGDHFDQNTSYVARGEAVELGQMGYSDRPTPKHLNVDEVRNLSKALEQEIDKLDGELDTLERAFRQSLARPDMPSHEIESQSTRIMATYRALVGDVKKLKTQPEAGNPMASQHVGKTDRKLKATMQKYQTLEASFRRESQQAAERQYRIVRPDATDAEVREAVSDPNAPIFQQALLSSDRRGQASSTLRNVKERHEAIQNIERQMVELAELFQDLDRIVQEQEPMVQNIETKGEEVYDNVTKGNEEIGTAIVSARSRNRKKWWCLLICIILIIIIAIIVAVVVVTNKNKP